MLARSGRGIRLAERSRRHPPVQQHAVRVDRPRDVPFQLLRVSKAASTCLHVRYRADRRSRRAPHALEPARC